jgi:hypothetical protein
MHQFPKFTPAWNSTCFGQFLCPSSVVYSLYTRHGYMSYRFEDSFRAGPVWHIPVSSVQWINYWWWAEELPETCRVSCRSKFRKLMHLVGFIIKKFVTMHGHMNGKFNEINKDETSRACYTDLSNKNSNKFPLPPIHFLFSTRGLTCIVSAIRSTTIPVTVRGSNPAGGMDICVLRLFCAVR